MVRSIHVAVTVRLLDRQTIDSSVMSDQRENPPMTSSVCRKPPSDQALGAPQPGPVAPNLHFRDIPKENHRNSLGDFPILIIDMKRDSGMELASNVRKLGCQVDLAVTMDAALSFLRLSTYALVFCDLPFGEACEFDLVSKIIANIPRLRIIVITACQKSDFTVKAVKAGAKDVLQRPYTVEELRAIIDRNRGDLVPAKSRPESEQPDQRGLCGILMTSRSPAMQHAYVMVTRAASSDVPVLLRGESGTGKGILARELHAQSGRSDRPFVTVNCPSLSDELLTSELFGHVKGSFTGATRDQPGKVEAADGGTLFLDELGDLSPIVQAKILRFLQDHTYERLGETITRLADIRIVAATNCDLESQVMDGRFREDLLYRLNVIEVTLPPLRERGDDIVDLARHFLAIFAAAIKLIPPELSPAALQLLTSYSWPGNIRELCNELQRIVVLWRSKVIEAESFSSRVSRNMLQGPILGNRCSLAEIESEHIRIILSKTARLDEAASILGIQPSTLWRKRRKLGLAK